MQLNSWGVVGKWDSCPDQQPAESPHTHIRTGPFPKPTDLSHLLSAYWSTEFGWAFCHQPAQAEEKSTLNMSRSQQKINLLKAERKVTSSLLYTEHISTCHISLLHISPLQEYMYTRMKDTEAFLDAIGRSKHRITFLSPSGHICVCFRSKHILKIWKKCWSTRQLKSLENAENKTIIHEMESAKMQSHDPLMPSMCPKLCSLQPWAKPAPPLGLGRGGRPSLLLVSSFPTSPWMFDAMCRFYDSEGTLHCALEQPSCSYAVCEGAFHFGMQSCSWASEKSAFHSLWSAIVV